MDLTRHCPAPRRRSLGAALTAIAAAAGLRLLAAASGAGADPSDIAGVEIAPAKTSIVIGSVSLEADRLVRDGERFSAAYTARVFPYFFYDEKGRLEIRVPEKDLQALAAGASIDFKGSAIRTDGKPRSIEGRATPVDANSGQIRVQIVASRLVTLVYHTTYRLVRRAPPGPGQSQ